VTGAALDRIVAALEAHGSTVRTNGRGVMAACPAHEDRNPSLSVTAITGQVLIHCHRGCETEDVLDALGLGLRDLYDEPAGTDYTYTDRAGLTVLRTVHRSPDKQFRQSITDKTQVPLYRLPEVVKANADEQWIYLVEGEKDVHALETLGVVATTAPMGAANWSKVDATPLHGGKVTVIVDRDPAGDRWARDVRDSLDGKVQALKFDRAKVGKDAADHVAAGYGAADFEPYDVAATGELEELDYAATFASDVEREARRIRVVDAARRKIRIERERDRGTVDPIRLTEFLATLDNPTAYRIAPLWPIGGRIVVAAQWKARQDHHARQRRPFAGRRWTVPRAVPHGADAGDADRRRARRTTPQAVAARPGNREHQRRRRDPAARQDVELRPARRRHTIAVGDAAAR
jgi:hypothetical protein